jgi:hypothetical protein
MPTIQDALSIEELNRLIAHPGNITLPDGRFLCIQEWAPKIAGRFHPGVQLSGVIFPPDHPIAHRTKPAAKEKHLAEKVRELSAEFAALSKDDKFHVVICETYEKCASDLLALLE